MQEARLVLCHFCAPRSRQYRLSPLQAWSFSSSSDSLQHLVVQNGITRPYQLAPLRLSDNLKRFPRQSKETSDNSSDLFFSHLLIKFCAIETKNIVCQDGLEKVNI